MATITSSQKSQKSLLDKLRNFLSKSGTSTVGKDDDRMDKLVKGRIRNLEFPN